MMKEQEIKSFQLEDLAGRTIEIWPLVNKNTRVELIVGRDIESGVLYLMKEIRHPIAGNDGDNHDP